MYTASSIVYFFELFRVTLRLTALVILWPRLQHTFFHSCSQRTAAYSQQPRSLHLTLTRPSQVDITAQETENPPE
ncbi:hypothetical protein E2C01_026916 [Portunus trituberculatus]|uniref:Uncharacterized protein n=1 Tax=Portunus trituberculatus TaxID=210409 RepID=A0A5B7EGK1_PORTR|nr:hypothetical protein [Portunus trituberculatus]